MTNEQELELGRKFATDKLGMAIPKRLAELTEILSQCDYQGNWYISLALKLLINIERVCCDLLETTTQTDALPAAAWNSRNLLELWIWTAYCAASQTYAKRFYDDALRDAQGLTDALSKLCELQGIDDAAADARKTLAEVVRREHGVETIGTKFEKVFDAAAKIGLEAEYSAGNKELSKYAHPTALLVVGIMHQPEAIEGLKVTTTALGVYYAGQSVMALGRMVSSISRK